MLFTFVILWSPVTILIWHRYGQVKLSVDSQDGTHGVWGGNQVGFPTSHPKSARTAFALETDVVSPSVPPSLRLTQVLGVFQLLLLLCGQTFLQVGVVYTLLPTHRWHVLTRDAYPRCLFCCARAEDKPPENLKELHAEEKSDPEVGKSKKRIRTRSGSFRVSLFVRAVLTEPKARRLSMWAEYICSCVQSN